MIRLLLDTQVLLWAHADRSRLGQQLVLLADEHNELLVSAVSSWEIAIKWALGRLRLPEPPAKWVPDRMRAMGATSANVTQAQALAVADLPTGQGDPFDRMLVTQCRDLGATLVSADPIFAGYDVELIRVA